MTQANAWTGISRDEMPQVDLDEIKHLLDLSGIYYEMVECDPFELRATQDSIDDDKVSKISDSIVYNTQTVEELELSPIIVSSDMMILDGHHRCAAVKRSGRRSITTLKIFLSWQEGLAWLNKS